MPATGRTWLRRWAATATVVVVFAGVLGGQASQAAPRQDLQQVEGQVRDLEMRAASAHEDAERACESLAEIQGQLDALGNRLARERSEMRTMQVLLAEDPTEFVAQTEAEVSDRKASAQQVQDDRAAAAAAQPSASNSGGPSEIAGQSGGSYPGGPRAAAAVQDALSPVRDPYREWFSGVGRVLD